MVIGRCIIGKIPKSIVVLFIVVVEGLKNNNKYFFFKKYFLTYRFQLNVILPRLIDSSLPNGNEAMNVMR